MLSLPIFALSNILRHLSWHYPTHALGDAIIAELLPSASHREEDEDEQNDGEGNSGSSKQSYLDRLIGYLISDPRDPSATQQQPRGRGQVNGKAPKKTPIARNDTLILATLTLLASITSFAGGKHAPAVLRSLPLGNKSLQRLFLARKRSNQKKKSAKQAKIADVTGSRLTGEVAGYDSRLITPSRPDIRTAWIQLLLALLGGSSSSSGSGSKHRLNLLSLLPSPYLSLFRGLPQDPAWLVTSVLQAFHTHVLSDQKLPRKSKLAVMGQLPVLEALLSMYSRTGERVDARTGMALTVEQEADEEEAQEVGITIAVLVHHFLLAVCTNPGFGITFGDSGWYPRGMAGGDKEAVAAGEEGAVEAEEAEDAAGASTSKRSLHNPLLFTFLRTIPPTRTGLHSELVARICAACPELVGAWLPSNSTPANALAQGDARGATTSWLASSALVARILALPLPFERQVGESGTEVDPSRIKPFPPPLSSVLPNLLPTPPLTRSILQRAITGKDRLAQHSALLLLASALDRVARFAAVCEAAHDKFGETQQDEWLSLLPGGSDRASTAAPTKKKGRWTELWSAVAARAIESLPDLNTLATAFHKIASPAPAELSADAEADKPEEEAQADTLLMEASLRCIWLYHNAFLRTHPLHHNEAAQSAVTRIDVGKLLQVSLVDRLNAAASDETSPFEALSQLHALRTVTAAAHSDVGDGPGAFNIFSRFSAASAAASKSTRSVFEIVLSNWLETRDQRLQVACEELLSATIGKSSLFELNSLEWQMWMWALRPSPSGASLAGDAAALQGVVAFIDECAQRCLKTLHKYIEAARKLSSTTAASLPVSPVLVAMIEQFTIRCEKSLFDETLLAALAPFVSRLLFAMLGTDVPWAQVAPLAEQCHQSLSSVPHVQRYFESAYFTALVQQVPAAKTPRKKGKKSEGEIVSEIPVSLEMMTRIQNRSRTKLRLWMKRTRIVFNLTDLSFTAHYGEQAADVPARLTDATTVSDLRQQLQRSDRPFSPQQVEHLHRAAVRLQATDLLYGLRPDIENLSDVQDDVVLGLAHGTAPASASSITEASARLLIAMSKKRESALRAAVFAALVERDTAAWRWTPPTLTTSANLSGSPASRPCLRWMASRAVSSW